MPKVTIEDVLASETPYLDVFGVETRPKGRPSGAFNDYGTSLEMPSAAHVEDRAEAAAIRSRVKARALAVVQAVMGEQVRTIYKAELALELGRMSGQDFEGRPEATRPKRRKLLSDEEVKTLPGSGLLPGETYWEWMNTYAEKDDVQWESEKTIVKANIERLRKGDHSGS